MPCPMRFGPPPRIMIFFRDACVVRGAWCVVRTCPDCSDLVDELAALLPDGADATTNAETLVILRRIERVLHRRLNGTSIRAMADELHFEKDFDGYEATLRAAKRNAREAYVRYRSMCDALDALPVKAADADYTNLDD